MVRNSRQECDRKASDTNTRRRRLKGYEYLPQGDVIVALRTPLWNSVWKGLLRKKMQGLRRWNIVNGARMV